MLDWEMDLQLFADETPDGDEPDENLEDTEVNAEDDGDGESGTPSSGLDQDGIQRIIDRKFRQWNKRLEEQFGTSDLEHISEGYRAGMAVSHAAGITPREVMGKLGEQTGGSQTPDMMTEIKKLQNLVMGQHQEKVVEQQKTEARKEFGEMFDQYALEIEELAEDRGLSLVDAAAVVLRPHLGKIYQQRGQAKTQNRRKRIEGSDNPPAAGEVLVDKLSPAQKRVAQRMGISLSDYAQQLKELGHLD